MDKKIALEATAVMAIIIAGIVLTFGLMVGMVYLFGPASIFILLGLVVLTAIWFAIYHDIKLRR